MTVTPEVKTVVTERSDLSTQKELNAVEVVAMPWWKIAGVRALRVYLQGISSFLLANLSGLTGAVVGAPLGDFVDKLVIAASLAVGPAVFSLLMNVTELMTKLDQSHPTLRA